jgi:integrase/recombinase XerD
MFLSGGKVYMDTLRAHEEWRFACQSRNYSPRSVIWNEQRVGQFLNWCAGQGVGQIEDITAAHVHSYLATLPAHLSDYTRRGYAQAVKAFLNWCAREDLISEKIARRITMPRVTEKVIQTFTPDQVKRLLASCEREVYPWMRARDRAILAVLLDCGLRASELCGLTLGNVHFGQDSYLQVLGKGRRERQVGLGNWSRTELHRYIYRHRSAPEAQQRVFTNQKGSTLEPSGLHQLIARLRDWAGVEHFPGVRVSPHTMRHTFALAFLAGGGDCYVLSRLLGHSQIGTTEVYLRAWQSKTARRGPSVADQFFRG